MAKNDIDVKLRLQGARKFSVDSKKAAQDVDSIGDAARRTEKKSKGLNVEMKAFSGVIGLVKPAALIASLGMLAQAASAAAAGGIALTAALVPAAGAIAAYPTAALAGAQGLGVFKLATAGLSDAIGGLHDKLDPKKLAALTPAAQSFAKVIQGLKPQIIDLQKRLQAGLFPGLTKGLRAATPALAAARPGLEGTAKVVGNTGARLGAQVGSASFLKDIGSQAKFNTRLIGVFGLALGHVLNVIRNVVVSARPLTMWLARTAKGWTTAADAATESGRKTGKLAAFFQRTQIVLKHLFSIVGSVATAFKNVAHAAFPLGHDLLVSIDKTAKRFAQWSGSLKGQNAIADFFERAKKPIYAVTRLVGAIGKAFGGLAAGNGVAPLIDEMTKLVPIISNVVAGTAAAFGPHMLKAIDAIVRAFAPFAGSSGPLILFVDLLTGFAKALLFLERTIPGFTTVFTALMGAMAVMKTIGLLSFTSQMFGFKKGLAAVQGGMAAVKNACILTRIQLIALKVQELAVAAASKVAALATTVFSRAMGLLMLAMDANPITLAVVAIVALGAAFVVAYRKIGFFHRAVNSVFGFIKKHWPLLLAILTGPIGLATLFIVRHFDQIKHAASSVYSTVRRSFNRIVTFLTGLGSRIKTATVGMFDGVKDAFRSALNFIINGWNNLSFHIGGTDLGPLGHLPDININTPDIPRLAAGGMLPAGRLALVGEQGPELVRFGATGARVTPASGTKSRLGSMARKTVDTGQMRGGVTEVHYHPVTNVFKVGGKEITRQVIGEMHTMKGRK
ncbi:MAG: hypothetical protein JWM31_1256 [Solirubrobacterales bacterium]|nr:hypothetical protein [Solirubrobacterales bacterium]